jgi:hypothetical protein
MTPSRIPLLVSPMLFGTRGRAIAAAANATPRRAKIKQAEPTFGVGRAPATRKVRHDSFQDRSARFTKMQGSRRDALAAVARFVGSGAGVDS